MSDQKMTPVKLRVILSGILIVIGVIGVSAFIFGYNQINTRAQAAKQVAADADASRSSLQNLSTTKNFLEQNSATVAKAQQLVSQSELYVYQDQIIKDLNMYASRAGIQIVSISFSDTKPTTGAGGATSATPSAVPKVTLPAGVTSTSASLILKNPVQYEAILKFIYLIEQSLFRMQISNIGLSQATATEGETIAPGQLASDSMTIEVYIRK